MKAFYLVAAILGTVLPLSQPVLWLATHGPDFALAWQEITTSRLGAFAWLDVMVSAIILIAWILHEGRQKAIRGYGWAIAGTCLVGVSLGLPLFLYLRTRAWEQRPA